MRDLEKVKITNRWLSTYIAVGKKSSNSYTHACQTPHAYCVMLGSKMLNDGQSKFTECHQPVIFPFLLLKFKWFSVCKCRLLPQTAPWILVNMTIPDMQNTCCYFNPKINVSPKRIWIQDKHRSEAMTSDSFISIIIICYECLMAHKYYNTLAAVFVYVFRDKNRSVRSLQSTLCLYTLFVKK